MELFETKQLRLSTAVILLFAVLFCVMSWRAYAFVFHGKDKDTGANVSRTAVDTIAPKGVVRVGLKFVNEEGQVIRVSFSSLDNRFKDFDPKSARFIIDGQKKILVFEKYNEFIVVEGLPPVHEFWYQPLPTDLVKELLNAKTLELEISTVDGISLNHKVSQRALRDVKEVLHGRP